MVEKAKRRGPGRPATLSRNQIVDAAVALVDETGTLKLAELGKRLGTDTSAMYRHFANRADLVSAIAEKFTESLREPFRESDDWRSDFVGRVERLESLYRSRPNLSILIMTEADLSGPVLTVINDGARILRRSGAPDEAVFRVLHGIEIAVFGTITYDSIGGAAADEVRRTYSRRVGAFDIDHMFPTAAALEAESRSTMWLMVNGLLDWLEGQPREDSVGRFQPI